MSKLRSFNSECSTGDTAVPARLASGHAARNEVRAVHGARMRSEHLHLILDRLDLREVVTIQKVQACQVLGHLVEYGLNHVQRRLKMPTYLRIKP